MRITSIDGSCCSKKRRARFVRPPPPSDSSNEPAVLRRAWSSASRARTESCCKKAGAIAALRDRLLQRLLVGEQRQQHFSLLSDDAYQHLRFGRFCPLHISVSND